MLLPLFRVLHQSTEENAGVVIGGVVVLVVIVVVALPDVVAIVLVLVAIVFVFIVKLVGSINCLLRRCV